MTNNAVASTSRSEAPAEPTVATKKPRPKPKKKLPTGSIDTAPSAPPSDLASTMTAVPRVPSTTTLLESIPPPEFLLPDIPFTIADRAKSRVRNAKSKPVAQDIIEIHSDEDERLLRLSPHRPKQKDVRGAKNRPIPNLPPPSVHLSQESLVTPTSDFLPAPDVSSQLPPSDPPSSTLPLPISTPESAKRRRQVADADDPDESPLNTSKRRKRQHAVMDDDEVHAPPPRIKPTPDQPPPNFFASSSSSLPPPPAPLVRGEHGKKLAQRRQVTDDVPPPEIIDSDPPKGQKGRPKPKKKPTVKHPLPKSAEVVVDSDEEGVSFILPPPPRPLDSGSPLSDLSERADTSPSKPVTPSRGRKRLVPEVLITTVPRKRTSSPLTREAEEQGAVYRDEVNVGPKGKKRQKKAVEEEDFDGFDDEVEVVPKKVSKGKGKAPPKGKGRTKAQPKEVMDDDEFNEDPANDAIGTSKKAKSKAKTKATTKTKSARPGKPRVMDSDDEATTGAKAKEPEVVLVNSDRPSDLSVSQQNAKGGETPPPQDAKVSLNFVISSSIISTCDLQEDQENTPPPPKPAKPNPTVTPSSVSRKTPVPSSASSFARLNYGHSIAGEEKPMSMAEIIRRANSATKTPSKAYSPLLKGSRSALKKIAPLHARRKTPPPLPPKPPPPKKTKKQLELEEKWEEELEETIEGWAALSTQEREILRKQKRDMEMGYED